MPLFKNFNIDKIKNGLTKTRQRLYNSIVETVTGKAVIDDNALDELENIFLSADVGVDTTEKIIENIKINLRNEKDRSPENFLKLVKKELTGIFNSHSVEAKDISSHKPFVILVVGVNGVGKTTTIGKLAYNFNKIGLSVLVGAADTFRAAAGEQLSIWAERAGVKIIQADHGRDPSSVAYETVSEALKENYDVAIIDTAGRLHNRSNLMSELSKTSKVIAKLIPDAPHETLLILDGNTGQNAVVQTNEFSKITRITGLVITKLDGTAKGGVVFQIASKFNIPVKYIGVGEGIDDLQEFDSQSFVQAIFEKNVKD